MPISYKPGFVSSIMLDIIDQVFLYSLVSKRGCSFVIMVLKHLICFYGGKFKLSSILPLADAVMLVNLSRMPEITQDFNA